MHLMSPFYIATAMADSTLTNTGHSGAVSGVGYMDGEDAGFKESIMEIAFPNTGRRSHGWCRLCQ